MRDGTLHIQPRLLCRGAFADSRPLVEPIEAGLPVVRMAIQTSAQVGVDVVTPAPRLYRQQFPAWESAWRCRADLTKHQPIIGRPVWVRPDVRRHAVTQITFARRVTQRVMTVGLAVGKIEHRPEDLPPERGFGPERILPGCVIYS